MAFLPASKHCFGSLMLLGSGEVNIPVANIPVMSLVLLRLQLSSCRSRLKVCQLKASARSPLLESQRAASLYLEANHSALIAPVTTNDGVLKLCCYGTNLQTVSAQFLKWMNNHIVVLGRQTNTSNPGFFTVRNICWLSFMSNPVSLYELILLCIKAT